MDITEKIDILLGEEIKSKRTSSKDKQYANKYYRTNAKGVLNKKKKLDASAEGKVRKRMKPIMKKSRKTPTGQHKRENNV
jgi:hypothetical protein